MKLKATNVFERNWNADTRFIVNQGGSRSSKTYSIAQKYIIKLLQESGKTLTITRKSTPSLRASVLRDFMEILVNLDLYDSKNHNKTENIYILNGNLVEFVGMDNPQKKRGAKRDYLWMNEANEFSLEDFRQLNMRTTTEVTLDFNPSDEFHWIYDEVMEREDCTFIKSTYQDNPFLDKSIVAEIERYKEIDENYWRVFGLGERGASQATVFTNNWEIVPSLPDNYDEHAYGVDFGFNHPMTMVRVVMKDDCLYWDEMYYERGKITKHLIDFVLSQNISPREAIICDHEKDRIAEFVQAGFIMTRKADKQDKISKLDIIKTKKMYITERSVNLIKEMRNYKFKVDRDGNVLDDVVKVNDDAIDAAQYASTYLLDLHKYMARTA